MKVYIVGKDKNCVSFMKDIQVVSKPAYADVVIFCGVGDVSKSCINETFPAQIPTNISLEKTFTKMFEKIPKDKICIGFGFGAQMLGVLNGSDLAVVGGHIGIMPHRLAVSTEDRVFDGYWYWCNSYHTKCLYPFNVQEMSILGYALDGCIIDRESNVPEIVEFHLKDKPKCLCIQSNPELLPDTAVAEMFNSLIHNYVNNKC